MLIHIGYHKTGTSWMQEKFFCEKNNFKKMMTHVEVDRYINKVRIFNLDPSIVRGIVCEREEVGFTGVISSEILSGSPLNGGLQSYENALKLKSIFPDAKILITIRNQNDFLKSIYLQYLKTGGILSVKDFMSYYKDSPSHAGWDLQHILYSGLVGTYLKLFGDGNVFVCQYESLSDKQQFTKKLCSFLSIPEIELNLVDDTDVNISLRPGVGMALRLANRFYQSYNNPNGIVSKSYGYSYFVKGGKFLGEKLNLSKKLDITWSEEELLMISKDNALLADMIGGLDESYIV